MPESAGGVATCNASDAPDRRITSPMISVRPKVTIRKALASRR